MKIRAILLVEDNVQESDCIREKLAKSNLIIEEVVVARTLAEALKAIIRKSDTLDVVLLDLDLEDSRSIDTLKAVRVVTKTVVIVLSDSDDEVLGVQSIRAGADAFLLKNGVTEQTLADAICASMAKAEMRFTAERMHSRLEQLSQMGGAN